MKHLSIGSGVVALSMALTGASIQSQSTTQPRTPAPTSQRPTDTPQSGHTDAQGFINDMALAGTAEVQLGTLATERAANADVR